MDMLSHVPVIDGDFIPDHPSALFGNAAQFDYMAGVNSMDGHFFAGVDVPSINRKRKPTTMYATHTPTHTHTWTRAHTRARTYAHTRAHAHT